MKTRKFESVKFNKETNKIECITATDFGYVVIKRTPRRHTAKIREEMLKGIYSFEIQGIMYCYKVVDFIENLRTQANTNGIRATFSYRCIGMVTKLEKAGLPLEQILRIAVFKGMTKDTINCFVCCGNKYSDALRKIKVA